MSPLQTPRLTLRLIEETDAQAVAALMTPAVSQWLANWPAPLTQQAALARITLLRAGAAKGQLFPYAILKNATFIGTATIGRNPNDPALGELGYWLGEPFHGQGFMREALHPILQAAFAAHNFHSLEAGAQPANLASLNTLQACGMAPAGRRAVFAPTRNVQEICQFFVIHAPR